MKYCIYKYVENNEIIYIGQTICLKERVSQHSKEANFINFNGTIFYFICNNQTEMNAYEYFLINKYQPKYNKQFRNKINVTNFLEPEWVQYIQDDQLKTIPTIPTIDNDKEYLSIKEFAELKSITPQAIYKSSKYKPYIRYAPELKKRVINKKALEIDNSNGYPIIEIKQNTLKKDQADSNNILILHNIIEEQKKEINFLKTIINNLTTNKCY